MVEYYIDACRLAGAIGRPERSGRKVRTPQGRMSRCSTGRFPVEAGKTESAAENVPPCFAASGGLPAEVPVKGGKGEKVV